MSRGDLLAKLGPVLERSPFEVHRAPSGVGALIFAANESYDLVVSELPVPGIDGVDFVNVLRDPSGPSRDASILLIGDDEPLLRATLERAGVKGKSAKGKSASRLMGLLADTSDTSLQQTICELMGVASRLSRRLMVELEVSMAESGVRWVCQSHNISASGMLLRTDQTFPLGTEVVATFGLPDDLEPIEVPALVVRHSHPPAECEGMAIQFLGLSLEDWGRLHAFVDSELDRSTVQTESLVVAELGEPSG